MTNGREDAEENNWLAEERRKVVEYLADEGCRHGGVAEWPVFYVSPHVALWAVQSTKHLGSVGWWAISGDLPTDYMSSSDGEEPRDALKHFAAEWLEVAGYLRRGEPHPTLEFGDPKDRPELAESLEQRAKILKECAADDSGWEE
jgi:hypothetical protein